MKVALKGVPVAEPRPRPEGIVVDNGEYYLSEFPPGQAIASLDLPVAQSSLDDFLNNARASDGAFGSALHTPGGLRSGDGSTPLAPLPGNALPPPGDNAVRSIPPIPIPQ